MPKFEPIDYALHYGGRCRDCADADGTCPTMGTPCDPDIARAVAKHILEAWAYGIQHGFIDNPLTPPPAQTQPVEAQEPVSPIAYVCEADIRALAGQPHGTDMSIAPRPFPEYGMRFPLYAAPQPAVAVGEVEERIMDAIDEYRESIPADTFGPKAWPTIDGIKTAIQAALHGSEKGE